MLLSFFILNSPFSFYSFLKAFHAPNAYALCPVAFLFSQISFPFSGESFHILHISQAGYKLNLDALGKCIYHWQQITYP